MFSQLAAVLIFIIMFIEIVRDRIPRYLIALIAGGLTIVVVFLGIMHSGSAVWISLSLQSMLEPTFWYVGHNPVSELNVGINWSTILFIAGMMIMVEGMSDVGFFDWLCLWLAKLVHYKPAPLLISFMILSAVLSMFIDSITVILFLAVATVNLGHLLKFDPIPMIIAEIFTANLGGSATMSGDPPNIIIGTALSLNFGDFLQNTGLIAVVGLVVIIPYFYFCFRKEIGTVNEVEQKKAMALNPRDCITKLSSFAVSVLIFLLTVFLLITHAQTGLTVAAVGVLSAILTLGTSKKPLVLLHRVDWKTLLFFMGLFVTVSGLEETGVLQAMANGIGTITGGNLTMMIVVILWLSAVASAFVDNIPFAATMVPVITSLSATTGVDLNTLAWTLSMGTDIGGSATPIGASANVAGTAIAAKNGHPISWGRYCKYSAPATVIIIAISMVMILMRY